MLKRLQHAGSEFRVRSLIGPRLPIWRRPMLWACAGALAIHVAAGVVFGWPQWGGTGVAATTQHAITVRYLAEASSSSSTATQAANAETPSATAPAESPSAAQEASGAGLPRRYFDVTEVDQPAMPTPDWALDPALLVRNAVHSLKVEVLVSETGRPERCTVLSMEPAKPALQAAIQRQLCTTRLTPAIRHGVAVPSVRHVEIVLSQE